MENLSSTKLVSGAKGLGTTALERGLQNMTTLVQIPLAPLHGCVTFGNLHNLFLPQFPQLLMGTLGVRGSLSQL